MANRQTLSDIVTDCFKEQLMTNYVAKNPVYVRSGPGSGYEALGYLEKDEVVGVFCTAGAWCKVQFHHQIGYVNKLYLQELS